MPEVVARREASVVGLPPEEYDRLLDRMLDRIARARESARDWPDEVRRAIDAGFEFASELEPDERMAFFNPALAGPAAVERRCDLIEIAATALERGRRLYPASLGGRETSERTLVSGVAMLASVHLLAGDEAGLERARAEAIEMVLAPYIGAGRARDLALA
jgi:hypothetical protein